MISAKTFQSAVHTNTTDIFTPFSLAAEIIVQYPITLPLCLSPPSVLHVSGAGAWPGFSVRGSRSASEASQLHNIMTKLAVQSAAEFLYVFMMLLIDFTLNFAKSKSNS